MIVMIMFVIISITFNVVRFNIKSSSLMLISRRFGHSFATWLMRPYFYSPRNYSDLQKLHTYLKAHKQFDSTAYLLDLVLNYFCCFIFFSSFTSTKSNTTTLHRL